MKTYSSTDWGSKGVVGLAFGINLYTLSCLLLMAPVVCSVSGERPEFRVETGQLVRAKYTIAVPNTWNGHLLLLAHGFRAKSTPLSADFRTDSPTYQHLLADGWMIASTSYRHNGAIIVSAAEDIDRLHQHIVKTYSMPKRVLLQGSSMGGAIVTLIAETRSEGYDGAVAFGAALGMREKQRLHEWTYRPRIPLLFVSNQSEVQGPLAYIQKASEVPVLTERKVGGAPALWYVARDGHVNLRQVEQEMALRALNRYVETGQIEHNKDATLRPNPASSAEFKDGGAYTQVTNITSDYGNINTEFSEADLHKLQILGQTHFQVKYREQKFSVFLASAYADVSRGEWVAFLTAEGQLRIARNFENAAHALGCKAGDRIFLTRITTNRE